MTASHSDNTRANAATPIEASVPDLILVTGLSGAGMSTALHVLEDLGYEAVDNLPPDMVTPLLRRLSGDEPGRRLAVGVGVRTRDFGAPELLDQLADWQNQGLAVQLVFMDCDDDGLRRRFNETRRRHPLGRSRPLTEAIRDERDLLAPIARQASLVIDTSHMRPTDLRDTIVRHFALGGSDEPAVFVKSFGYRYGLPADADLVFDVRFLANPHYEPELRNLTGMDGPVQDFVVNDDGYESFMQHLKDLLGPLLPGYRRAGKSYLTIAFGCTGGWHRSVVVAEALGLWLSRLDYQTAIMHRELDRSGTLPAS